MSQEVKVGTQVVLGSGGMGRLNPTFLLEEGYIDQTLTIDDEADGNRWQVTLPKGCKIWINRYDIAKIVA